TLLSPIWTRFPYTTLFRSHTGKFAAESVRGRQAECMVQRQILSPGTAKLRRVQRTKQPKRSRGSGLPFASPLRRAQQKQGTATRSEEHTSELQSRFDLVCR